MAKNILIKISGDLVDEPEILSFIAEKAHNTVAVVCVGGGTQINKAFEAAGIPLRKHGSLGREHQSDIEKDIANHALSKNAEYMISLFEARSVSCKVISPILDIGGISCHVNGDQMVLTAYLGFDELYILTTKERVEKKKLEFANYPKVVIVGI